MVNVNNGRVSERGKVLARVFRLAGVEDFEIRSLEGDVSYR